MLLALFGNSAFFVASLRNNGRANCRLACNLGDNVPVEAHKTHEKTILAKDKKYGCYNRMFRQTSLVVKNGIDEFGRFKFKLIEDFGSRECRYDMSLTDSRCKGCTHAGSGEQYANQITRKGS